RATLWRAAALEGRVRAHDRRLEVVLPECFARRSRVANRSAFGVPCEIPVLRDDARVDAAARLEQRSGERMRALSILGREHRVRGLAHERMAERELAIFV